MGGLISAKLLFVLVVGLIVLGPEKLPDAARSAGRLLTELRRLSGGLQTEVREAFDTSDLAEPVREFRAAAQSFRFPTPAAAGPARSDPTTSAPLAPRPAPWPPGAGSTTRPWNGDLGPPPGDPSLN